MAGNKCGAYPPTLGAEYIEKMEDALEVYERPYDPELPVVCLDERAVQLRADKRQGSPAKPGKPMRFDYEYVRLGTANIFCVVEPLAGKHITRVAPNRSGAHFAKTLMLTAHRYPHAKTIHLVMDDLNSHTLKSLTKHYGEWLAGSCGRASPCTTRPSTRAGSTRPRSRSASSTVSA